MQASAVASGVEVINDAGELVRAIDLPSPTTPNLTFLEDGKSIYVMSVDDKANAPYLGKVYKVPLE